MKLTVVTPRYGVEVPGGAETAARLLAARMAALDGWSVEALTTCALDAATWADHYPTGSVEIDGVTVRRFPVKGRRATDFDACTDLVVRRGRRVTDAEQQTWLDKQGPISPALVKAIARSDADVIAFHPFLYHPTVAGLPRVAARAVLHPAAHDEPMLKLPMYREVFAAAAGLAYWSDPEQHLVERRFAVASKPAVVVGLGVDAGAGERRRGSSCARSRRSPVSLVPRPCRRRQGRAPARRMLRPLQGTPTGTVTARVRGSGRERADRAPRRRGRGRGRRAGEVGIVARRVRARVAERVRIVLDRVDGGVDGRHARARQPPLRGDARPRTTRRAEDSPSAATATSRSRSTASTPRRSYGPNWEPPAGTTSSTTTAGPMSSSVTARSSPRSRAAEPAQKFGIWQVVSARTTAADHAVAVRLEPAIS